MILRYPGSKWKQADAIISQLGYFEEYREAMLGSGAVFWRLPKWSFKRIWLNDYNSDLMRLFRAIKGELDPDFIRRAVHYCATYDTPGRIRDIWSGMTYRAIVQKDPAAYWFLNRYAVAGIVSRLRKTPASLPSNDDFISRYIRVNRFTRDYWLDRRRQLRDVQLTCLDYKGLLSEKSKNRCSCYVDVPYRMEHHCSAFYERYFTDDQHRELRDAMLVSPVHVVLTTGPDVYS